MNQQSTIVRRAVGDREYDVVVLTCGDAQAELWPALGGNCVSWSTAAASNILWSPPMEELVGRPTRGGVPVLFPFPNRIRAGRYSFAGREYQLPCNDSTKLNAIHGFSPRVPWRLQSLDCSGVTLSFCINRDAPECAEYWPGDATLTLAWTLSPTNLRCRAEVRNHGTGLFPFGIGFHPYFRTIAPDDTIRVLAKSRWELKDSLPTGIVESVNGRFDLRQSRRVSELQLDDVYTGLEQRSMVGGLAEVGRLQRTDGIAVTVRASNDFREMVVFTPPHGHAVCLEPYTCPTDAINLAAQGKDVGWLELGVGEVWTGEVQYEVGRRGHPDPSPPPPPAAHRPSPRGVAAKS